MAINLSTLARALSRTLHNSSESKSGYSPPSSGTIPGTGIQRNAGMSEYKSVARKGRKGDTELRKVGGEVSHVNKEEAKAIDWMGPLGEAWVKNIGAGTRNPSTGLPEYHYWHKHGAHTGLGKAIESGISYISGGEWESVSERNEREANVRAFGRKYEDSGGEGFYNDKLDGALDWNIASFGSTALEEDGALGGGAGPIYEGELPRYGSHANMMAQYFKMSPNHDDYDKIPAYDINQTYGSTDSESTILKKHGIAEKEFQLEFGSPPDGSMSGTDIKKAKLHNKGEAIGQQASTSLFGLLTQSQEKAAKSGFQGQGDFAASFKQDELMKNVGKQHEDLQLDFEEVDRLKELGELAFEEVRINAVQDVRNIHDAYNKEFHGNFNTYVDNKYG